jgi:hypothetical protein
VDCRLASCEVCRENFDREHWERDSLGGSPDCRDDPFFHWKFEPKPLVSATGSMQVIDSVSNTLEKTNHEK